MTRLPLRSWERESRDGAGCLIILGLLGLLPVSLIGWWILSEIRHNLQSAFNLIQWRNPVAFIQSFWRAIHSGSGSENYTTLTFILCAGYLVLLWQWITYLIGRRAIFAPRRLWAVSSAYFAAVVLFVHFVCYQSSGLDGSGQNEGSSSRWSWLVLAMCLSMPPTIFLSITVPLWLSAPRTAKPGGFDGK